MHWTRKFVIGVLGGFVLIFFGSICIKSATLGAISLIISLGVAIYLDYFDKTKS